MTIYLVNVEAGIQIQLFLIPVPVPQPWWYTESLIME